MNVASVVYTYHPPAHAFGDRRCHGDRACYDPASMAAADSHLRDLILRTSPDAGAIAAYLDGIELRDAVTAARTLSGRKAQGALWQLVAGNPPISVGDLVPLDHEPMQPVVFHGKNSLPAFTEFQKICCLPPSGTDGAALWGYNETTIKSFIGPGYYVVHDTGDNPYGGVAFDYTRLPGDHPPGWPAIRANSVGLSRFIYNNTIDYMRRVAGNVFIGLATRGEKSLNSYFVLVRELGRTN